MRFSGSDLSSEYPVPEVYWDSYSWSEVAGDESTLGVRWFAHQGKLVLLICSDCKSRHQRTSMTWF